MTINKDDIVRLRKASGQPIMDCKKALQETNSFDDAFEYLRRTSTEKIDSKRKDRISSEGRVVIKCSHEFPVYGSKIVMASLLCETDFTAKSDAFVGATNSIVEALLKSDSSKDNMDEIENIIIGIKAQTGEKVELGQTYITIVPENTSIGYYVHFDNKKAAMVQFEANSNPASLQNLGQKIAMHVVATKPQHLDKEEFLTNSKKDFRMPEGFDKKPVEIQEKIMEGLINKSIKENVLLYQPYCLDDTISVDEAIKNVRREEMMEITLKKFRHIEIGG